MPSLDQNHSWSGVFVRRLSRTPLANLVVAISLSVLLLFGLLTVWLQHLWLNPLLQTYYADQHAERFNRALVELNQLPRSVWAQKLKYWSDSEELAWCLFDGKLEQQGSSPLCLPYVLHEVFLVEHGVFIQAGFQTQPWLQNLLPLSLLILLYLCSFVPLLYILTVRLVSSFSPVIHTLLKDHALTSAKDFTFTTVSAINEQLQAQHDTQTQSEYHAGKHARESLRMTAHEIRRPLQRLSFAIQALEDESNIPADAKLRHVIHSAMDEISTLVDEALWYARVSHGPLPLQLSTFTIEEMVAKLVVEQTELFPHNKFTQAPGGKTPSNFQADRKLCERALSNLLGNAVKHGAGKVLISWQWTTQELILTVHDNGPGIPRSEREQVFEPFITASSGAGVQVHGGLGLAIVKGIAESHGGIVKATESPLGGCAIILSLPVRGGMR